MLGYTHPIFATINEQNVVMVVKGVRGGLVQLFVRLNKIQFLHNAFKLQTSTLIFGRCSINVLNNSNNIISPLEEDQRYLNLQKEKGQKPGECNAVKGLVQNS